MRGPCGESRAEVEKHLASGQCALDGGLLPLLCLLASAFGCNTALQARNELGRNAGRMAPTPAMHSTYPPCETRAMTIPSTQPLRL